MLPRPSDDAVGPGEAEPSGMEMEEGEQQQESLEGPEEAQIYFVEEHEVLYCLTTRCSN